MLARHGEKIAIATKAGWSPLSTCFMMEAWLRVYWKPIPEDDQSTSFTRTVSL